MALSDNSDELYHPVLLAMAREHPRLRSEHDAKYVIRAYNPLCGDKFEIRIDAHDLITDTSFYGYGCVVSKASTAVLTEMLVGKTFTEARELIETYLDAFHGDNRVVDDRLRYFTVARKYPGRMRCATLAWEAVLQELK